MNLMMYIGNELIESVPLDRELISKPGYVGNFKRRLQNKYRDFYRIGIKPEFFVVNGTSVVRPAEKLILG